MTLHFGNHFCYHAANTALDGIIEGLEGLNKALENQSEDPDFSTHVLTLKRKPTTRKPQV